jgi:hypothetical protein
MGIKILTDMPRTMGFRIATEEVVQVMRLSTFKHLTEFDANPSFRRIKKMWIDYGWEFTEESDTVVGRRKVLMDVLTVDNMDELLQYIEAHKGLTISAEENVEGFEYFVGFSGPENDAEHIITGITGKGELSL